MHLHCAFTLVARFENPYIHHYFFIFKLLSKHRGLASLYLIFPYSIPK